MSTTKIMVHVLVTTLLDGGKRMVEESGVEIRYVDHQYNEAAIASALLGHLDDELRWQDENTSGEI